MDCKVCKGRGFAMCEKRGKVYCSSCGGGTITQEVIDEATANLKLFAGASSHAYDTLRRTFDRMAEVRRIHDEFTFTWYDEETEYTR